MKFLASSPTVRGQMESMLASAHDLRPSTRKAYLGLAQRHIYPVIGDSRLGKVSSSDIRDVLLRVADRPDVARNCRILLSRLFRLAMIEGIISTNPVLSVTTPRRHRRVISPIPVPKIRELADEIYPRYRVPVLMAAYCGLRISEIAGLMEDDVSLFKNTIMVRRAAVLGAMEEPKTHAGRRTITMPAFLTKELSLHITKYPPVNGLIFTSDSGGMLNSGIIHKPFHRACKAVGISARFHDLRHTSASLAILAGAHPKVIQVRLGHASIQTTLDVYGHLFDNLDSELARRLDSLERG